MWGGLGGWALWVAHCSAPFCHLALLFEQRLLVVDLFIAVVVDGRARPCRMAALLELHYRPIYNSVNVAKCIVRRNGFRDGRGPISRPHTRTPLHADTDK